ncbi:MAG: cytochrome c [Nitrospira sp.]|nr:cytochrome c [Nitrospira sp.]
MNQRLIRGALTLVILGAASQMNGHPVLANDGVRQNAEQSRVSGNAAAHPMGDGTRGEKLYNASCVVCHGPQATGGIGPRLTGNPVLFNEPAFWKVVYEGRHVMPPLKGAVTEQQMADIQAWLKTLR